jgi:hypothetical protein
MVTLYVADQPIGTLDEAPKLIAEFIRRNFPIEFKDDNGELVGRFFPVQRPTPPEPLVPWDPTLTQADLDRIAAEPGLPYEEVRKRLGWK